MRVVFYGNATFSLFSKGLHILCDPWFEAPAVAGAFVKFPPCPIRLKDIPRPDFIYISHIHSDHCEYETLEALDKEIPVIGLARQPAYLEKMLYRRGFRNLLMIPEKSPTQIHPGLRVETFGATYRHFIGEIIDSSILFDFDGYVVLNCNDNSPWEPFCKELAAHYPKIDLAFLPSSGGGAYPSMYENLTDEMKDQIVQTVLERKTAIFSRAVDLLKPSVVVPVAGGYAIRGLLPSKVNWQQCRRLNLMEVVEYHRSNGQFKTKIVPLQPGMELQADTGQPVRGRYRVWTRQKMEAHFSRLSRLPAKKVITTQRKLDTLIHLMEVARRHLWERQKALGIFPEYRVYFDLPDQPSLIEVDLKKEETLLVRRENGGLTEPYLRMKLDQDTMLEWLLGFEDFNMLDSGHRIVFYRAPNTYVQEAYYLMSLLRL